MNSFKRKLTNDTNFNPPPFSLVNIFNSLVGIGSIPFPLIQRPGGREGGWSRSQLRRQQKSVELSIIYFLFNTKIFLSFSLSISLLLASQVPVSFVAAIWANHEFLWAVITGGLYGYVVQTQFSPLWAAIIPRGGGTYLIT